MTERQRRFCEEYMVDLCAARAARRAGYSESTATTHAAKWINPRHPEVPELREEIDRMLAERARQTRLSANGVVRELAKVAFDGEPAPEEAQLSSVVQELAKVAFGGEPAPEEAQLGSVVQELTRIAFDGRGEAEGEGSTAEGGDAPKRGRGRSGCADGVRTQDRLRALELLGKHLGMFTDNLHVQSVQPVIVDEIERADDAKRAEASGGADESEGADADGGADGGERGDE